MRQCIGVEVRVWGELACFTRPEFKVERVSYPVMTPSAARGVLEAIYWHPDFSWRVREIRVLAPVRTLSLRRNEVQSRMTLGREAPYFADGDRTQRLAICLRDVDYVIVAEPESRPAATDPAAKHRDIFNRRVARGQCFHRPSLGTREFAADFGPAEGSPEPLEWTEDLGLMLWDLDYAKLLQEGRSLATATPAASLFREYDESKRPPYYPLFFHARVEHGILKVPDKPIGERL